MMRDNQLNAKYFEKIKQYCLMDDDFMSKCFEDNIECTQLVVNIVLNRKDLIIEKVHTQHKIKNLQGRSIILDIYATDNNGKKYNIEIQRSDKGAHAKRARYHSSLLDANITKPGDAYENLLETYVIFITEKDIFGYGKPIYHIKRKIQEVNEVFEDGTNIIYVNGEYRDDSPLGLLMKDFACTNPEDIHYEQLATRVRYLKNSEKGVSTMGRVMDEFKKEIQEETIFNERRELAKGILKIGILSYEQIAKCFKLSLEEVQELAKEVQREQVNG